MIGMTQHFLPPTSFWYIISVAKEVKLDCNLLGSIRKAIKNSRGRGGEDAFGEPLDHLLL